MSKKKDGISAPYYKTRFLRRSRELYRKYLESKPWVRELYSQFLEIKPGIRIVDVGCGTGDFTRYLSSLVDGKCQIVGVDSRAGSLKIAASETKRAGLVRVEYKLGDAYSIPLPQNFADLTCCRALLLHLTDPLKAVKEMTRVTKPGGRVAAVEPGEMWILHDPQDREFTELAHESNHAQVKGWMKLEGKEFGIGERLPYIFQSAGLSEIRAEIQADAWIASDARLKPAFVKGFLKFQWQVFKETKKDNKRILLAGGMSAPKVQRLFRMQEDRFRKLLASEEALRRDTVFSGNSLMLVTGRNVTAP